MPRYVLTATGTFEYTALGFTASTGNILIANAAPDSRWGLNGDQAAAETVTRYVLGSAGAIDVYDGGQLVQHAIPDQNDGGTMSDPSSDIIDGGTL